MIPIRDLATFAVVAVQAITADGRKQTFGPLKGNAFVCGNDLDKSADWFVVEGWADAISILRAVNNSCVFAACGVNVFEPLRDRIGEVYGPDRLVLMEDAAP
ncbi:MAG: hypothetical protein U9Q81_00330 [Pseudomonadota bacterium]|nr:hypothetical protein [Pseudomonadota bacterium]